MRVLVVGSGGVGSAFVAIASSRDAYEHITVADIDLTKAEAAVATAKNNARGDRVVAAHIDASSEESVAELARAVDAEVILNACDPRFNPPIFEGAFQAGCHYVDMAMNLSQPHPTRPVREVRDPARRRPVRAAPGVEEPGPDGARRDGGRARFLRCRGALRRRRVVLVDHRDRGP